MEERSTKNIAHNALVAIFLRLLEYYQDILVLTTNCVKNIDDVIHSRAHMMLQYPSLSVAAREKYGGISRCISAVSGFLMRNTTNCTA
ncbi:uncharacterized protein BDW43DRAFT_288313 [Aspergillus alliaceus]|uniref:uncharacterized protein n=1 Tax=Petromyces alliaceus TaxID=209559 RepID=UPI0012A6BC70|nr:uncharacterized protein BDW43DRAFT_288313 [Aspergillus alliaceus]KAB8229410.1 hypothetical protein BDW43DRAFT_288313 [Aspergillus alliaceus]